MQKYIFLLTIIVIVIPIIGIYSLTSIETPIPYSYTNIELSKTDIWYYDPFYYQIQRAYQMVEVSNPEWKEFVLIEAEGWNNRRIIFNQDNEIQNWKFIFVKENTTKPFVKLEYQEGMYHQPIRINSSWIGTLPYRLPYKINLQEAFRLLRLGGYWQSIYAMTLRAPVTRYFHDPYYIFTVPQIGNNYGIKFQYIAVNALTGKIEIFRERKNLINSH